MARRAGVEGTVKETPKKGSGVWIALLPPRLSRRRQRSAIPSRFNSKTAARRALSAYIADIDRGARAAPSGVAGSPVRRVRHAVRDYIDDRTSDPDAPIAVRTQRDYGGALRNQITLQKANIGDVPIALLTAVMVADWLKDLAKAKVPRSRIDYARRVLTASLAWEVSKGRLPVNPASQIRQPTSKARRALEQVADPVFLPTWKELADLVIAIPTEADRILVTLMAWGGLRWSEAVSLEAQDIWKDRPLITVRRVLVKAQTSWIEEAPKGGLIESVPLPTPLWLRLKALAEQYENSLPDPAGNLIFRTGSLTTGVGVLDNNNFRRRVWLPATTQANLRGDASRAKNDSRRKPMKIKDLRAFAASVLVDAGASMTETALLLRHADHRTTERHYARAMHEKGQDPARMSLRLKRNLTLTERIEALWDVWAKGFPEAVQSLGIQKNRAKNRAKTGKTLRLVKG
jgi:integrase